MKHEFEKCATCGESIYTWPSGRKECLPQHRLYIVRQALKEINAVRFHSRSIGSPVPEGTANLRRAVDKTTGAGAAMKAQLERRIANRKANR